MKYRYFRYSNKKDILCCAARTVDWTLPNLQYRDAHKSLKARKFPFLGKFESREERPSSAANRKSSHPTESRSTHYFQLAAFC